jgi:NitT/TauT family transport system ATP-binding protein
MSGKVVLEIERISKTYGHGPSGVRAIDNLDFEVRQGEFCSLVGPSGCGKTTLMKILSGLVRPTQGCVKLHGDEVVGPPADMALVFQDYSRSLLPWMSVLKNVKLPLKAKGIPGKHQETLARDALEAVGLTHTIDRYPWQLSGGMQQRVAIARALAYQAKVLLMDEPFASVDAQTRADLEDLLLRVWQEFDVTIVFVTHDIDEAVYMSSRVVVLRPAPTSVKEAIEVDLDHPRDQLRTRDTVRFAHLRSYVYTLVKRSDESEEVPPARPEGTIIDAER